MYFKRVYAFLYKLTSNHDAAEEMVQETFYRAFVSFHKYDGSCEMFTWLAAIAKNVFFKYLSKQKLQTLNIDLIIESQTADSDSDPEAVLQQKFIASYVNECVSKLPQKYRDVVFLRIYAELPFSQIADILGITENSAKVVYYRAKNALRKDLFKDDD
jgi:RNA polymerase sigma-70 factor (ECF subfamily)